MVQVVPVSFANGKHMIYAANINYNVYDRNDRKEDAFYAIMAARNSRARV